MITYRRMEKEEKEKLYSLRDEALSCLENKEFFIPFKNEELNEMLELNKVIVFGAYDEEKLVGSAQITFDKENLKKIIGLENDKTIGVGRYLVLPSYRNQGIMKQLQSTLIEEAKKMNFEYAIIIAHPENKASNVVIEHSGANLVKTTNVGEYIRNIYLLKI